MLMQVAYRFPTDSEIRYLDHRPHRGDRVRGRGGEFFIVSHVDRDGDAYVARCVMPSDFAADARRASRRLLTVAQEMRERARELKRWAFEHGENAGRQEGELTRQRRPG